MPYDTDLYEYNNGKRCKDMGPHAPYECPDLKFKDWHNMPPLKKIKDDEFDKKMLDFLEKEEHDT